MYTVEWLAKDEVRGGIGGWLKLIHQDNLTSFVMRTLMEGGAILSVKKAD